MSLEAVLTAASAAAVALESAPGLHKYSPCDQAVRAIHFLSSFSFRTFSHEQSVVASS